MEQVTELEETLVESDNVSEWLSFSLGHLTYAVDILRVKEIRTIESMTRVPYAQGFVLGLINLRGAIVPIVDLRMRFDLDSRETDKETVVLIMNVDTPETEKTMGIVVDQISDVINLKDQDIKRADRFDLSISNEFVSGITDVNGAMAVLLNIDTVLNIDDF